MKRAVFIERDGVLNELVVVRPDRLIGPIMIEEFKLFPEQKPQIASLQVAGFVVLVTTNQPGLSRGYQSRRELDRMHGILRKSLGVNDIFVCPHDQKDHCPCRVPRPGLLIEAAFKWHLNLEHSFVISDKWQDAEAARTAGCISVLIKSPWLRKDCGDMIVESLEEAVKTVISKGKGVKSDGTLGSRWASEYTPITPSCSD